MLTKELNVALALCDLQKLQYKARELNISYLLKLLKENKVPFALAKNEDCLKELLTIGEFELAYKKEIQYSSKIYLEYQNLYNLWKEHNIRVLLIKSTGEFPYTSDNIDILVTPGDFTSAESMLHSKGYVELSHLREPFKRLYRRFTSPNEGFAIHLHTGIAWITSFLSADEIFESARISENYPGIIFPGPEHSLLINTAHWFYEDKELKLRDLVIFFGCLKNTIDLSYLLLYVGTHGWTDGFISAVKIYKLMADEIFEESNTIIEQLTGIEESFLSSHIVSSSVNRIKTDLLFPYKLSKYKCKFLHYKKSIKDRTAGFWIKIHEIWLLTKYMINVKLKNYKRQHSFIVSLSGIDYSGKTTLAKNIITMMHISEIKCRYKWMRIGVSKFLEVLKFPVRFISGYGAEDKKDNRKQFSVKSYSNRALLYNGWMMLIISDIIIRMWLQFLLNWIRGGIIIFDRYYYDHIVDMEVDYKYDKKLQVLLKVFDKLLPRCDMTFMLNVDPEEMKKRAASPSELPGLTLKSQLYRKIYDANMVILKRSLSASDLSAFVYNKILTKYFYEKVS